MGWATAALEADMRDGTTYRGWRRNEERIEGKLPAWRKGPQRRNVRKNLTKRALSRKHISGAGSMG
jgi:hypothetical protein